MTKQVPHVGQTVLFYESGPDSIPQAAIVTGILNKRVVNACVFNSAGMPMPRASVNFVQPDDPPEGRPKSRYCEVMP